MQCTLYYFAVMSVTIIVWKCYRLLERFLLSFSSQWIVLCCQFILRLLRSSPLIDRYVVRLMCITYFIWSVHSLDHNCVYFYVHMCDQCGVCV